MLLVVPGMALIEQVEYIHEMKPPTDDLPNMPSSFNEIYF